VKVKEITVARHKSSVKRAKQTLVKTERNKVKKSLTRNIVKKVRAEISAGSIDKAKELLPMAQSLLAKAAKSSAISKVTASRIVSRLAKHLAK